ncbi:bifunctional methylenetetrahydrofolate dehydrogenase/methenyltetrahydrofolate cyclohydrolase FolD [Myxococcota bacterium]|nr:bifunctional methylenetetrahydrofolate dehydrogenase/methenyltetrahydrofolate cyclohydrolase FolD [Myxococcota bacterium]MBU1537762.1 bifunctional methylenetetrahydrofolate dehydrogenase/methenyltetrahydrofolate cyclohydrolase FolD [Myxococcota bacterium]
MAPKILDGKALSKTIRIELKKEIDTLTFVPTLAVILVGDDPASAVYVSGKERDCHKVGINSILHRLPAGIHEDTVRQLVSSLNDDPQVDGILIQLPLPSHLDEDTLVGSILPQKDVDGFLAVNQGLTLMGNPHALQPCTPMGVMELLTRNQIPIAGREAVVVGRSMTVGKPVAALLTNANATVTLCHSRTRNLQSHVERAEILVVAAGKRGVVDSSWIQPGAVVIDVGIHRLESGELTGDLDHTTLADRASAFTPVPGGVGPMTRTMLLKNTLKAAKSRRNIL